VDEAIARKPELNQWRIENARAVAEASSGLIAVIQNPPDAVAYAAGLDPQLRAALIVAILES
jgi:sensor domain CHASE-containing protein